MLKVIAYSGSKFDASSRFRIRQYIPSLEKLGVELVDCPSLINRYPPRNQILRYPWAIANLYEGFQRSKLSYNFDVSILQREFLSTKFTNERFTKLPRVLDVDDAIFLSNSGIAAKKLALSSQLIICGNSFLAQWFSQYNANIVIIPTAVDTSRYTPTLLNTKIQLIGWSGSSSGLNYLYSIESEIKIVLDKFPHVKLRIVCDRKPIFLTLDKQRIEFLFWSIDNEIQLLQDLTIGIMPLSDTDWERGKCSYKMLCYMSCGIPVVVSDVGMNSEVLAYGNIGIGVRNNKWADALIFLLENQGLAQAMGVQGREVAIKSFDTKIIAIKLHKTLSTFS